MSEQEKYVAPYIRSGWVVRTYPVRWKPYNKRKQWIHQAAGRWQRQNKRGKWVDCKAPMMRIWQNPMVSEALDE